MLETEPASPLHETILEVVDVARGRGMTHSAYPLEVCAALLSAHAPTGELVGTPCGGCLEHWPCRTVLGVIGGLHAATGPGTVARFPRAQLAEE